MSNIDMKGVKLIAYRESIAREVLKLVKRAPKGVTTHYLKHFDQKDVADTVNALHRKHPNNIRDTYIDYSGFAPIEIEK